MGSTLILASWGDPSSWNETTYVLDDIKEKSKTSLRAVARRYTGAKALVIVQETLLAPKRPDSLKRALAEAGVIADPPLAVEVQSPEDYNRLLGELRLSIEGLAKSWLSGIVGEVRVGIAPGVGSYSSEAGQGRRFRATWSLAPDAVNPFDYYASIVLLHILREMPVGGPLTLAIDLTHGMNYTGTAVYRAALAAARIYSTATHETVRVEIYNSEPWNPGAEELRVWRVRTETIHYKGASSRLVYMMVGHREPYSVAAVPIDRVIKASKEGKHMKGAIAKELKLYRYRAQSLSNPASMAAASMLSGSPLLLLQAGLEADNLGASWEGLVEIAGALLRVTPVINISRDGNTITIRHLAGLDFANTKSLFASLALASFASRLYASYGGKLCEDKCGYSRRVAAPINTLKDVVERFTATPLASLAEHELSLLERSMSPEHDSDGSQQCDCCKKTRKDDLYQRVSLAAKHGKDYPAAPERASHIDKRIFSAHAGLNSNITDVLYRNNTVMIAYNCSALNGLRDISNRILVDLRASALMRP